MSAVMKPRRHPQRDAAEKRFSEMAMPGVVAKELGLPSITVYFWWRAWSGNPVPKRKKPPREYARECALSSDADPLDEAQ